MFPIKSLFAGYSQMWIRGCKMKVSKKAPVPTQGSCRGPLDNCHCAGDVVRWWMFWLQYLLRGSCFINNQMCVCVCSTACRKGGGGWFWQFSPSSASPNYILQQSEKSPKTCRTLWKGGFFGGTPASGGNLQTRHHLIFLYAQGILCDVEGGTPS